MKTLVYSMVGAGVLFVAYQVCVKIDDANDAANRSRVKNDLKSISLALHNYHDEYSSFPPAFVVGPDGERWHSWRALILPQLDPTMAAKYHFDEPWNGPRNSKLHNLAPDVFQSDLAQASTSATGYFAVVGKRTLWPAHQALSIRDIMDGTSNTIMLLEDSRTDINWLEPADMLPGDLFRWINAHKETSAVKMVALADGSVRALSGDLDRSLVSGLLTPQMFSSTFDGDDWPSDLVDPPQAQQLTPPKSADQLTRTFVSPVDSAKIEAGQNALWCVSFQMSWNMLKERVNGDVKSASPNKLFDQLNASSLGADLVAEDARFTAQTNGSPGEDRDLLRRLDQKFPQVDLDLEPFSESAGWMLRLFSLVRKHLSFETVFDRFQRPLQFNETVSGVNSFGCDPNSSSGDGNVFVEQLTILDDQGDDDFIVQLSSVGNEQDQIILAKISAESTLAETWGVVEERIANPNPAHHRQVLQQNETLQIPILDFSIRRHFQELEMPIHGFRDPARIAFAVQEIRLRLDETGADFMSAGEVGVIGEFGGESFNPDRIRKLIFDKPFLIALKEPTADYPYFLGWIANTELMEKFTR